MVRQRQHRMDLKPNVVYRDDDILVIDKPSGLLTIPDGYDPDQPHLRGLLEPTYGKLWIVHRLDKETSGLVILARNQEAHRHLNEQFSKHLVEKVYWAIIIGVPPWDTLAVEKSLRSNVGRRKRTIVDELRGKPAKTWFTLIKRYQAHALVKAQPQTGRTHQIRAHLYSIGYPILADPLYGAGDQSPFIDRLALHAGTISLIHPTLGERITLQTQENQDFVKTLQLLPQSVL